MIKEGTRLGAADPISHDNLQTIKVGEQVTAKIRRARNPKHHRKLFALLQACFENQSTFPTVNDLLIAIKIANGYFDTAKTIDGIPVCVPRSISFTAMTQTDFETFYQRALDIILTKILPGVNRDELVDRVNEILGDHPSNRRLKWQAANRIW